MIKNFSTCLFLILILISGGCGNSHNDQLYNEFVNPQSEYRPFVRWWWNGNCVEEDELKRELEILSSAGIGGVEINSIAMPRHAAKTGAKALEWAGEDWINMVKAASLKAKELGMSTDIIVGSGWPFGGRFLDEDETMQRLGIKREKITANSTIDINLDDYLRFNSRLILESGERKESSDVELISLCLVPDNIREFADIIDLTGEIRNNRLFYETVNRDYTLVAVYNERNFNGVYYGSPGADGPIMDHYQEDIVLRYLERLLVIEQQTDIPLSELFRALFCDSIELSGSNWTDDMKEEFRARNGYDVTPWLPLIIQPSGRPNKFPCSEEMSDKIKRVQYDFYNTIISVFLERFTTTFQDFCTENHVLCRYQSYGIPYYMGLFQGNMIPDIPESNNWLYSRGRDEAEISEYTWVQNHGYMLWNKAASAAAHVRGKKIVSSEAMTNTSGVFRTSLETIKQSDDINFITGITHSVLHGFNYSPPEAGFPGWMRFGAYFSEQNTWWKYFNTWTDYNARLSAVFQNSEPVSEIAVLGRLRDYWGETGAVRAVFNDKPWYYAQLWQPISNLGYSCDYIHQPLVENAVVEGDEMVCGEMRYKALILTGVESVSPAVAEKLDDFAAAGGKLIFIGNTPYRSLSYNEYDKNDKKVREMIAAVVKSKTCFEVQGPEEDTDLLEWTRELLNKIDLEPQVKLSKSASHLYTMKKLAGNNEIFFITNSDRRSAVEFEADLNISDKYYYLWLPESGDRFSLPAGEDGKLKIRLEALQSALIVSDSRKMDLPVYEFGSEPEEVRSLNEEWEARFDHVNGSSFSKNLDQLIDFRDSDDTRINSFAGTVTYTKNIENKGDISYIRLDNVNEAVTELYVNGRKAGMRWYGKHLYDVGDLIKEGNNRIEIILTTTLANYCMSLEDNPAAEAWTRNYKTPFSSGLESVVYF